MTTMLSQPELAAIEAQVNARISQLSEEVHAARESFCWARLVAGHVRLVNQIDRAGDRVVVIVPCEPSPERALTAVENRIARRAGQALTNREIAAELKLSQTTVENHLSRALRKLGIPDRVALARLYTQLEACGRA